MFLCSLASSKSVSDFFKSGLKLVLLCNSFYDPESCLVLLLTVR